MKNNKIVNSLLELIGNTPLLRLNNFGKGLEANILVKCEYLNPSGSIKDRMALRMVEDAEKEGAITPSKTTLTDASSGNTAMALSMVGAIKGYKVKFYFPEATGVPEKIRALERYGAELEVVPMDDPASNRLSKAAGLHGATIEIPGRVKCYLEEQENPDHVWIRQYSNPGNIAGQANIGWELLEQTDGKIDVFVTSIGTGGTFLGVSRVLKEHIPNVKCIVVQPSGWVGWEDPLSPTKKYIPNISGGILEEIRDSGIADEIVFVGSDEARATAYRLSQEEGVFCGMSSGANVFIAAREASKPGMKGKNVVSVIVDRGDRYLTHEKYTT